MSKDGSSPAPVQPGDVIAAKYRVEKILGQGGMGVVVAALHLQLDERADTSRLERHGLSFLCRPTSNPIK